MPATCGDFQYSEITYHDLSATTDLSNFILEIVDKTLDCTHVLYNSAYVAAQGDEMQSMHRDMHKNLDGLRALTLFHAENYDLAANDGTDTIILPGSKVGLPEPWDPVMIHVRRGISLSFIPPSFMLVELCPFRCRLIPAAKLDSWSFPTFRSHINLRKGSMSHFGHSRSTPRSLPSRVAQGRSAIRMPRICA